MTKEEYEEYKDALPMELIWDLLLTLCCIIIAIIGCLPHTIIDLMDISTSDSPILRTFEGVMLYVVCYGALLVAIIGLIYAFSRHMMRKLFLRKEARKLEASTALPQTA